MRNKGYRWVVCYRAGLRRHDGVVVLVHKLVHANWFKHLGVVGADGYLFNTRQLATIAKQRIAMNSGSILRLSVRKVYLGGIL